jgi:hypothetical protein
VRSEPLGAAGPHETNPATATVSTAAAIGPRRARNGVEAMTWSDGEVDMTISFMAVWRRVGWVVNDRER